MLISLLCIFHIDTACVISHAVFQQQPGNTTTEKFLRDGGLFLSLGKIWEETSQCDLAVPFFLLLFSLDWMMGFLLTGFTGASCGVQYYTTSVKS